jgi:hypothetical protein
MLHEGVFTLVVPGGPNDSGPLTEVVDGSVEVELPIGEDYIATNQGGPQGKGESILVNLERHAIGADTQEIIVQVPDSRESSRGVHGVDITN